MRPSILRGICALAVALAAVPAFGCPVCDTGTGRAVRAGVFNREFGPNLLAAASPFAVFLGVALALHRGYPRSLTGCPEDRS